MAIIDGSLETNYDFSKHIASFKVSGNNKIIVEDGADIRRMQINMRGDNHYLYIGKRCSL